MSKNSEEWSLEQDCERYERLLAEVKSKKFWTADRPGRPTEDEFRQQVERLQSVVDQLREAMRSR